MVLTCSVCVCYPPEPKKPVAAKWQAEGISAALEDPLPSVRLLALQRLNKFSKADSVPASRIVEFLKDHPDSEVRLAYAEALRVVQAKDQAPELGKLLQDPDGGIRAAAAETIGVLRAREQVPELVKLLKDHLYSVSHSAAEALGAVQAREQIPELVKLLKDRDEDVRRAAVEALGAVQAREQIPELVKLLKDRDDGIRAAAIEALGVMQAREHAPELVKLLRDPRIDYFAAQALGAMQAKDQVPELVKLLKDPNGDVRISAVRALDAMQAKDQAPEVAKLLKDPRERVVLAAVYSLGSMQATDQAQELVKLIKERTSGNSESAAAQALGAMRARDQAPELAKLLDVRGDPPQEDIRQAGAKALGAMQAKDQAPALVRLLKDDGFLRGDAAAALGAMEAKDQAPELLKLVKDSFSGHAVTAALSEMGPFPGNIVVDLSEAYYSEHSRQAEIRFLCYYLTGGNATVQLVIRQIMFEQGQEPAYLSSVEDARKTLIAFRELMPARGTDSGFGFDADRQVLRIAENWKGKWSSPGDDALFSSLRDRMDKNDAAALGNIVETPWWKAAIGKLWKFIAAQIAFWVLLLYFYPKSPHVQAFFFWNRWARKFIGLGYVDLLLSWFSFLRNRLLAPFREELAADARNGDDGSQGFFEDVEVQELQTTKAIRLSCAIPEVRGQIVLEGESGLGKSIFLRRLVRNTEFPIAYLPADSCDHGVLEAIQLRLKGKASDDAFLKSIIWSGGLRIVIDGLNEVSVETRVKIRRFLDDFPKAHILLATQPLLWKRPPKARVFRLLKLSDDRILAFLESRYATFTVPAPMSAADYQSECKAYLDDTLREAQPAEDRAAARLVLSNPMDASVAARILVSGSRPTLTNLQEQQFQRMKADFEDTHPGQEFPLLQLSESIYERRILDNLALDSDQFFEAVQPMVAHKMVLEQNDVNAAGIPTRKWVFRHEKIRDYFLMQALLSQQDERIPRHIDDPRFRGVYLMLASRLPLEQARELKDSLVDRASETKDHHLSDAVVQVLKTRRQVSETSASLLTYVKASG